MDGFSYCLSADCCMGRICSCISDRTVIFKYILGEIMIADIIIGIFAVLAIAAGIYFLFKRNKKGCGTCNKCPYGKTCQKNLNNKIK